MANKAQGDDETLIKSCIFYTNEAAVLYKCFIVFYTYIITKVSTKYAKYTISLRLNICNGYIVIVQLFVMIQWMWRKFMLFILFLCVSGMPTTCVYAHT